MQLQLSKLSHSKSPSTAVIRLPASETPFVKKWLEAYRPALLRGKVLRTCAWPCA